MACRGSETSDIVHLSFADELLFPTVHLWGLLHCVHGYSSQCRLDETSWRSAQGGTALASGRDSPTQAGLHGNGSHWRKELGCAAEVRLPVPAVGSRYPFSPSLPVRPRFGLCSWTRSPTASVSTNCRKPREGSQSDHCWPNIQEQTFNGDSTHRLTSDENQQLSDSTIRN